MKTILFLEVFPGLPTKYELGTAEADDTGYNQIEGGTVEDFDSLECLMEQADEVFEGRSLALKGQMNRVK